MLGAYTVVASSLSTVLFWQSIPVGHSLYFIILCTLVPMKYTMKVDSWYTMSCFMAHEIHLHITFSW